MSPPTATARCPSCGTELRAALGPSPTTQWFPCPTCHQPVPFVPPRELPPLFSWEVVPGLYPPLAAPRPPRWRIATVAAIALAAAAVLSAVSAGLLAYDGYVASEPATYLVSGAVYRPSGNLLVPLVGATVALSSNGEAYASTTTGTTGTFSFPRVPAGGIELNVTASGYGPLVVYTFASRSYSTQTQGLALSLSPGTPDNQTVTALTPFGDLETLLAYAGGSAVLLGLAAATSAVGAIALRRPEGAAPGVIGAGAAVAVPALLVLLSVAGAFPVAAYVGGAVGGAGGFSLALTTVMVASRPPPRDAASGAA
jgi:hypothetical protein